MIFAVATVLIIGVIAFTLFIRQQDIPEPEAVSPTAHLEEKKKIIYENLRDLQFEYRMDKLSDEDYKESKLALQRQLAAVLAEIEQVQKAAPKPKATAPVAEQPRVWVCPNCASKYTRPMKFCGECGQAIPAAL
jgi:hypothetical protein